MHVRTDFSRSGRRGISDPVGRPLDAYRECGRVLGREVGRIMPKVQRLARARGKK